jgi:hypothetical protein
MADRDLFAAIRAKKQIILSALNVWREEIEANAGQAATEPGFTLGKLLGFISYICNELPKTYSLLTWTYGQDHYCRIDLCGPHEFSNDIPEPSFAAAFFQAEAKAVDAILKECFSTKAASSLSVKRKRPHEGHDEVVHVQPEISPKSTAKKRTHLQIDLRDHSLRGLFAALAMHMRWLVDCEVTKNEATKTSRVTITVDTNDGRPPVMVQEDGPSDKSARQSATIKFFELLNQRGIIRPLNNLPPPPTKNT